MAYTTIDNPELYFQTKLYTGNYSTQSITLDGSENMQPDMIWIKERSVSGNHQLQDSVRGTNSKLMPNSNDLEGTDTNYITSFDSNGFSIGANNGINQDGVTNVAWCWKKTATAGFDIVTATGTGSAKTISHSLSAVPHVIISKEKTGSVNDWVVYHHKNTSAPETDKLILNENNATSDDSCWNDTTPTSSVFSVSGASVVNRSSSTYVYYLFSEKQGFSKFGSYTGNGNANGPFVYTGMKSSFIMLKETSGTSDWSIYDNKREPFNVADSTLEANTSDAEAVVSGRPIDILSNGFKLRGDSSYTNESGASYIYMAFAESPFVSSGGISTNAR